MGQVVGGPERERCHPSECKTPPIPREEKPIEKSEEKERTLVRALNDLALPLALSSNSLIVDLPVLRHLETERPPARLRLLAPELERVLGDGAFGVGAPVAKVGLGGRAEGRAVAVRGGGGCGEGEGGGARRGGRGCGCRQRGRSRRVARGGQEAVGSRMSATATDRTMLNMLTLRGLPSLCAWVWVGSDGAACWADRSPISNSDRPKAQPAQTRLVLLRPQQHLPIY